MDGAEFLKKMRAGDASVWDEAMPFIRRITLGACRDLNVPESWRDDIVQDVIVKVFTHWESYRGDSKFGTWVYAIARNRCLDEFRKHKARGEDSVDSPDDESESPLNTIIDETQSNMEQMLCIQQIIAELEAQPTARKGSMRMIDVLRWWVENEPTTEELATFLETTAGAAKERKRYIREQFEILCQKYCGHDKCAF